MIKLKTLDEVSKIAYACKVVAEALEYAKELMKPGVTAYDIDRLLEEFILDRKVKPAFKGYAGYPAATCISPNEVVVHGIPSKKVVLKDGDIVSIDLGAIHEGFYGDGACTYMLGAVDESKRKLVEVTREALDIGVKTVRAGVHLGDVSYAIQSHVEGNGFNVIRDYVGHGIGRSLHEDPQIPNYGVPGTGPILRAGMTLAIEPMVSAGDWRVEILNDGWTAVTLDRSPAAHFEHTILVTDEGVEILTKV